MSEINKEPTYEEVETYRKANPHHSWYTAREELRDALYSKDFTKRPDQSWGDFWKSYS